MISPVNSYTTRESCTAARLYWSSTQGLCFVSHAEYLQYVEENEIVNPAGGTAPLVEDPDYIIDIEENNESYGYTHGVAGAVFDAFEIEYKSKSHSPEQYDAVGGALPGMDIKSQDAMSVVKASLTEAFAGRLYSLPVDIAVDPSDGKVEFFEVGTFSGNVTDIYQVVHSESYQQKVAGCMVVGKKPIPYRRIENKINMLADSNIYNMTMYTTDCVLAEEYDLVASVVYKDPLYMYDDLWYSSGWGSLVGHIHDFRGPNDEEIIIHFNANSTVPQHISDGFPSKVYTISPDEYASVQVSAPEAPCVYSNAFTTAENTLFIRPEAGIRESNTRQGFMPTFESLGEIILVGRALMGFKEVPTDCSGDTSENSGLPTFQGYDTRISAIKLSAGQHYAVKNDVDGAEVVFISKVPGYLKYGEKTPFMDLIRSVMQEADVFPMSNGEGLKVDYTMATLNLNLPSIVVEARLTGAMNAARKLKYYVSNIVIYDEQAPVAINGELIDMTDMQPHRALVNPMDYIYNIDRAISEMDQGRAMDVNLGTLGELDCEYLSGALYELMEADDGVVTEYMCGPFSDPQLGGLGPNGGIINSIAYKYQDEASYLVYAVEGSPLEGMAGFSNTRRLATETLTLTGKVVSKPSGGLVKVYIEKFGTYKALIAAPMHLRVGDIVSVTLHNYPREVA